MDITDCFDVHDLWPDTNGDGYPDDLGLTIGVDPGVTDSSIWAGILNLTARVSFETTAFNLPIVRTRGKKRSKITLVVMVPGKYPRGCTHKSMESQIWRPRPDMAYLVGNTALEMGRMLNRLAFGEYKGVLSSPQAPTGSIDLLNLAGENGIYATHHQNPRSRILKAGILLETPAISHKLGLSLTEMAAMMSLGATEITLPIAGSGKTLDSEILFKIHENSQSLDYVELLSRKSGDPQVIRIQGNPRTLPNALKKWFAWTMADGGPGCKDIDRFREQVAIFQQLVSGKSHAGRRLHAQVIESASRKILKTNGRRSPHKPFGLSTHPIQPGRDGKIEDNVTWAGEIEVLLGLASGIPIGRGKIQGLILLSKPREKRSQVRNVLEEMFRSRGYEPSLMVLNAYKPGLCWLMEVILPELKRSPAIDRLDIFYKPFVGMAGALELHSRWLQELFPVAELMAAELGLQDHQIRIAETPDQPDIYRILARSDSGQRLIDEGFSPRWSRMMFVEGRPDLGHVHPTTGGIRLWQNDHTIMDQAVDTDRERFWQIFQKSWLPALMDMMRNQRGCNPREHVFAFWENIRFNVWIEETEEILYVGEERICPMEALHEDLYFVLLAAFADLSENRVFQDFLQLGRITPKTYSFTRGKKPSASLFAQPLDWPAGMELADAANGPDTEILGLHLSDKSLRIDMSIPSGTLKDEALDALIANLHYGSYDAERFPGHIGLWISPPGTQPATDFRCSGKQKIHAMDAPPGNRLLLSPEVKNWLNRFDGTPHLKVWRPATSYQNRPVWAIEAVLESRGKWVSIAKLRLLKPTVFCNARHHANEVSSTNACLGTAWTLATTLRGLKWLRDVNVVFIPVENPDGVATLEELLPQGPGRKHHAARYNALGAEYYSDYFRASPRFPEAAAKPRLWKRWMPEIMIDHHGVPSHEWDQPFSGYAPRRFQEYWIPRTFVYALMPFMDSPDHPLYETAQNLAEMMAGALKSQPDIAASNREIAARYQRYARGPQPDVFPPTSGEPLLVYPLSERSESTNFAVRYPEITRSDIIVEVPDEIASGVMLERCVRAHRKIQEAAILFLQRPKGSVYKESDSGTGTLRILWK
jgi:hypothetical protein